MNYVVALLLLELNEEDSFWVMAAVIDRLYPGIYDGDLSGTQIGPRSMARCSSGVAAF